jgi:uncharacterized protein YndB with AHSA1/START domain
MTRALQPSASAASSAQWPAIARTADDDTLGATIEIDIFIPSSREAVFRFFVDAALMSEWLGEVRALEAHPDGILRIETAFEGELAGQFLTLSPPKGVAWKWTSARDDAALAPSRVDIELVVHHEGTLVRLVQDDPPVDSSFEGSRNERGRSPDPSADDATRRFWRQALAKLYAAASRYGGP